MNILYFRIFCVPFALRSDNVVRLLCMSDTRSRSIYCFLVFVILNGKQLKTFPKKVRWDHGSQSFDTENRFHKMNLIKLNWFFFFFFSVWILKEKKISRKRDRTNVMDDECHVNTNVCMGPFWRQKRTKKEKFRQALTAFTNQRMVRGPSQMSKIWTTYFFSHVRI